MGYMIKNHDLTKPGAVVLYDPHTAAGRMPIPPLPVPHTVIAVFRFGIVKLHARDKAHANWIVDRMSDGLEDNFDYTILEGTL